MPSVGTILRGARVQAGLTLEHISAQTCIPVKVLEALERDDLTPISSAFFYKSFVRQFAGKVNLPYESLADAVAEKAKVYPETFGRHQFESVVQHAVVKTRKRPMNLRSWLTAGSAALLLVACSGLYAYWEGKSEWLNGLLPARSGKTDAAVAAKPEMAKAEAAASTGAAGERGADGQKGFHVEVSAIETSWLSIVADGRQTFSGILEKAQSKFVEGHENGRVRTGNAGGLKVVFNGKPVGIVGPRGQIRIVVFTKDNYEVLEPARTETASAISVAPRPVTLLAAKWSSSLSGGMSDDPSPREH